MTPWDIISLVLINDDMKKVCVGGGVVIGQVSVAPPLKHKQEVPPPYILFVYPQWSKQGSNVYLFLSKSAVLKSSLMTSRL